MSSPAPDQLGNVALFHDLSEAELATIAEWLEIEEHAAGHHIVNQGAAGYAFFILSDGTADVTVDGVKVRELHPGDFFGEMSILGEGRRTATVTASTPATVWSLFGTRFRELQQHEPRIAAAIEAAARARHQADDSS